MNKISERLLYKAKWISLKEINYKNNQGKELKWESIERTNTTKTVVIIGKLVPSERYIFIKQYRPAIDNYIIGFPAGLVEREDIEKEAQRELKEETGYVGKIVEVGMEIKTNPALLTDSTRIVKVEIDENDPINKEPKQNLEPSEDIEVILVNKNEAKKFLQEEKEKGVEVGIGPWYIFGFNL